MKDFTKYERRTIRELAQIAWERELRSELTKLQASFDRMGKGELSPFDLNQEVHEFHQGVSRELYKRYEMPLPWFGVCGAFSQGVLSEDDIEQASERIKTDLNNFRTQFCTDHK